MRPKIFRLAFAGGVDFTGPTGTGPSAIVESTASSGCQGRSGLSSRKGAAPSPDPLKILQQMCDFLKSQQQFSYKAEVVDDEVYSGGKKLQYEIDMETWVRRPDRLRVNAEGDLIDKQFFFDGKTITLYDKDHNVYGTMEVPPDIENALEKASKDFGVRVALTDLASPTLWEILNKGIKHSLLCRHVQDPGSLAITCPLTGTRSNCRCGSKGGEKPLPRKVVLTHKDLPAEPQWTAYLYDWNFSPQAPDNLFAFYPASGGGKDQVCAGAGRPRPGKTEAGGKEEERR